MKYLALLLFFFTSSISPEDWRGAPYSIDRCEDETQGHPYRPNCRSYWLINDRLAPLSTNRHGIFAANPPLRSERKGIARGLGFLASDWLPFGIPYDSRHPAPVLQRLLGKNIGPTEIFIASGPFFSLNAFTEWLEKYIHEYDPDFIFVANNQKSSSKLNKIARKKKLPLLFVSNSKNANNREVAQAIYDEIQKQPGAKLAIRKKTQP
jgi:hypothetical protein